MAQYVSINGELVAEAKARIHVSDLTFRRAYGAFDFLRVEDGVPLFIDDYLTRFSRSAGILRLELPPASTLKQYLYALLNANGARRTGVQMFLTGGYTPDGYTPVEPNLVMLQVPLGNYPPEMFTAGVKLMTHEYQRDLPAAKTTNYMMAVYLRDDIKRAGAVDALYHWQGRALETTRCNLFTVTNGVLVTPEQDVLHGVTRKQLLHVAEGAVDVERRPLPLEELLNADEVFITSSTKGAMPIVQIDQSVIGKGEPGEVTRLLMERFETYMKSYIRSARVSA